MLNHEEIKHEAKVQMAIRDHKVGPDWEEGFLAGAEYGIGKTKARCSFFRKIIVEFLELLPMSVPANKITRLNEIVSDMRKSLT